MNTIEDIIATVVGIFIGLTLAMFYERAQNTVPNNPTNPRDMLKPYVPAIILTAAIIAITIVTMDPH